MSNTPKPFFKFSLFGNDYNFTTNYANVTILLLLLCCALGLWQLNVAHHKHGLIELYNTRSNSDTIEMIDLQDQTKDFRYFKLVAQGIFDTEHQILIANRTYHGQLGYDVLTPLRSSNQESALLINRGWLPALANNIDLPDIDIENIDTNAITVNGTLIFPTIPYFHSESANDNAGKWPLVLSYIDIDFISKNLDYPLYPYILLLDPDNRFGYVRAWKPVHVDPEKNIAYAEGWFLCGFILALCFIGINVKKIGNNPPTKRR